MTKKPKFTGWRLLSVIWLLSVFIVACAQIREVPSAAGTIVFKTDITSIILFGGFALFGVSAAVMGIYVFIKCYDSDIRHDRIWGIGLGLFFLVAGIVVFYFCTYKISYSEVVVIDKLKKAIKIEKHYFLDSDTEYWIPFADISSIIYKEYTESKDAKVNLILSDYRELEVGFGWIKFQYRLAKAISDATGLEIGDKTLDLSQSDAGKLKISTMDISARFINNLKDGKIFVITGKAKNGYDDPRELITITGKLYSKGKQLEKTEIVFCGNTLTDNELLNLNIETIKERLSDRSEKNKSNLTIDPGKVAPFIVVFSSLPNNLEQYTIEVSGSSQAQ